MLLRFLFSSVYVHKRLVQEGDASLAKMTSVWTALTDTTCCGGRWGSYTLHVVCLTGLRDWTIGRISGLKPLRR